jgi:hypothetical protein
MANLFVMQHHMSINTLIILLLLIIGATIARKVIVSNVTPRRDVKGNIIDAHDGCLVQFNNTYYIYGTVYGRCKQSGPICDLKNYCGFYGNTFALYSSPDLANWTLVTDNVVPEIKQDSNRVPYWMPNVAYNQRTQTFFMIFWSGHFGFLNSTVAIATSKTATGPFKLGRPITLKGASVVSSTTGLFVDSSGNAYIRYNTVAPAGSPRKHVVELLTDDWLDTTGKFSVIFSKVDYPWYEGGGMLEHKGQFYVMIGEDCCFCQWGGSSMVFTADHPLGEWKQVGETNYCADGHEPPQHVADMTVNPCSPTNPYGMNFTIPAQQFNVAVLSGRTETVNLYYGERFKSSADGLKADDFQAWIPLEFDPQGNIKPMKWLDQFEVDLLY